jgi:hypothetical protein
MRAKQFATLALTGVSCMLIATALPAAADDRRATGLVRAVREATAEFRDPTAAVVAGYASLGSCVSGPEEGAMGVHFANGPLVGDGMLDASRPELLIYEQRGRQFRLLGVEYLVIATDWHASNMAPPVLMGQHFQYVASPNRYGLPAFYELHVWAWKNNPLGMFVDWNPTVSCEEYTAEEVASASAHSSHP